MGLFNRFRSEQRAETLTGDILLSQLLSDKALSIEEALAVPGASGSVNFIADKIAQLPIRLYRREGNGVVEVTDDSRLYLLNVDTGDTMTPYQMKQALVRDYFISNNGGNVYIERDYLGELVALRYVDARNVSFMQNFAPIHRAYSIMVAPEGTFYPHEFIRLVRHSRDGITGRSVLAENAEMLKAGAALIKYTTYLMRTGGAKKGFLKSSKKLTDEALEKLRAAWARLYGTDSTNNMMILNDGIDYAPAQATSVELQLSENQATVERGICMLFKLSPEIIAGKCTYQQQFAALDTAVVPIVQELEDALNSVLLLESEKGQMFFKLDTDGMCRADIVTRFKAYETGMKNSFLQLNDVRRRENLEPYEGMDGLIRLTLNDVLYNTETHTVFNINAGTVSEVGDEASERKDDNEKDDAEASS